MINIPHKLQFINKFIPQTAMKSYQPTSPPSSPKILYAKAKLQNINAIEDPSFFFGGLFIGDIITLMKKQILQKHHIQAILSCVSDLSHVFAHEGIVSKVIKVKDTLEEPINKYFDEAYEFIERMREEKKNVLVHCHAGISRSATMICAYLMRKKKWRLNQTLEYMRKKRERIKPNENFIKILVEYEEKIWKKKRKQSQYNFLQISPRKQLTNFREVKVLQPFSTNRTRKEFLPKCEGSPIVKIGYHSPLQKVKFGYVSPQKEVKLEVENRKFRIPTQQKLCFKDWYRKG